ncbi:GNAT family N-acetyltransferase [Legionella londiniensis]|uniref:GNAT family acetyltransferase n=1 Tax=Legionella londiniensis TaxID=45068 RepID=A0A0W0VMG5_9GAMM|nr:GNAT family N-acetyltransferase [Legionella londiniensis]KTD21085.1 GNAT family acetyltransferase [Legionella londiniensis]STX93661.1 GNAT family acetyltransferase [Legionella londiniensis]
MKVLVKKVSSSLDIEQCLAIRREIFVDGQKVPLHLEVDGQDPISEHFLLIVDDIPAGAARVRFVGEYAKIERVAVLKSYQGKGLGKHLMEAVLAYLASNPSVPMIKLSAQTHALSFYEKLGFSVCSETYLDAGIPHQDMKMKNNFCSVQGKYKGNDN